MLADRLLKVDSIGAAMTAAGLGRRPTPTNMLLFNVLLRFETRVARVSVASIWTTADAGNGTSEATGAGGVLWLDDLVPPRPSRRAKDVFSLRLRTSACPSCAMKGDTLASTIMLCGSELITRVAYDIARIWVGCGPDGKVEGSSLVAFVITDTRLEGIGDASGGVEI